jgi:hypothetical protein
MGSQDFFNKIFLVLLFIPILFFVSCKPLTEHEIANLYKLDLQYIQNSKKFSSLGMNEESYNSCMQTSIMRNDCFSILIADRMSKNITITKDICDEIIPDEKTRLTTSSLRIVYENITDYKDSDLSQNLDSKQRTESLKKIRSECYKYVKTR